MEHLIFEWDEAKAAANLKKHGISFQAATKVFDDPQCLTLQDRFENGEYRWQAIGMAGHEQLLLVAHTYRDEAQNTIVRIISARKVTKQERKKYGHR